MPHRLEYEPKAPFSPRRVTSVAKEAESAPEPLILWDVRVRQGSTPARPATRPIGAWAFIIAFGAVVTALVVGYVILVMPAWPSPADGAKLFAVMAGAALLVGGGAFVVGRTAGSGPINYL
ncbi:MAG: hypothetical protein AAF743_03320 [Planctomycetota bacterium]